MKYTIAQYAEALYDALEKKTAKEVHECARRFLGLLQKNGDSPRLLLVLRAYEKIYLKRKKLTAVTIETASAVSAQTKREIKKILGSDIVFTEQENAALQGGIRITVNDEMRIDASAKRLIAAMLG